jgi:hypothetical protein
VELLEGGAGSVEVGEFHPRIFSGEDDAVGVAVEGGADQSFSLSLCLPSFFLMSGANSPIELITTPTQACVMTL